LRSRGSPAGIAVAYASRSGLVALDRVLDVITADYTKLDPTAEERPRARPGTAASATPRLSPAATTYRARL
jgi:hypothetical protein